MRKRLLGSLLATAGLGVGLLVGPLATDAGAAQPRATSNATSGNCVVIPLTGGLDITICVFLTTP
jgi:hypothetical protein